MIVKAMKPFLLLLCSFIPMSVYGTGQIPEILVIEGEEHQMFSTPLEDWLLPDDEDGQEALRTARSYSVYSSACWRGYKGTWATVDGMLVLTKIAPEGLGPREENDKRPNTLHGKSLWFPDWLPKADTLPLKATWFTGTLRIPQGEELRYVHMGFGSIYENDLFLEIEKGKLVSKRTVDNKETFRASSDADLRWMALGGGPKSEDQIKWIDARVIPTMELEQLEEPFQTRGILYTNPDGESSLIIHDTPTTESISFPLSKLPAKPEVANGSHIEITCALKESEEDAHLSVKSIRALKPGETIHHPSFKPPKDEEKKTE